MKFMRFLFVQLALALFQIDLAVKQEIEQLPEQEEEPRLIICSVRSMKISKPTVWPDTDIHQRSKSS